MNSKVYWSGILLVWTITACSSAKESKNTGDKERQLDTLSILGDPFFEEGLVLKRAEGPSPGTIYPFGDGGSATIWEMAEWASKHELSEADRTEAGNRIVYANEGKTLSFERLTGSTQINMDVFTSTEYEAPRQQNQAWPHLLIEQKFPQQPYLKDLEGLILRFTGRLTQAEMKMAESDFNPGLHTAQFQLFITVQDLNPSSAHYGDYLWFGIPFYDYRNEIISVYAAQDVGKGDATGKFIYSAGSADFMEGTFHSGDWIRVEKDIRPLIVNALDLAKQRGYLTGSFFEDFRLSGMNLGWEVPGTFDVGFEFKDFDLQAVTKK